MKKATITLITTAALACAIPLFAAGEPGMKSDSQQQGMKSDSQRQEGLTRQGMESHSQRQEGLTQQQSGQIITAEELEGMEVVSQKGEELGEIEKITINKESGEVQFVTFSRGGILGMGGEEIAVPLSAFEISDDKARLTVDQTKLENVPQQTAEATDSDFQRDLETHYGVAPAWDKGDRGNATQLNQSPTEPRKADTQN